MGIAALVTWILTAGGGFYMLAKWVGSGGHRQPGSTRFPRALIFGHFLLAATGLVLWIIYLVTDNNPFGWIALIVLAPVVLLGFVMLGRWIPIYRSSRATVEPTDQHAENLEAPPERSFPVPVVAAHGVLAVATVILTLLAMLHALPQEAVPSKLVIAPDFEDTTIAREYFFGSGGSGAYSTEQAHGGTHSIKIVTGGGTGHVDGIYLLPHTRKGANSRDPSTAIKVQPGQKFYMECWVYPKTTNTAGGTMVLGAILKDSTGNLAGLNVGTNRETYLQAWEGPVPPAGQWTGMSGYITIPGGYDLLWPVVLSSSDVPTGNTFYYDDALVREETT